MNICIDCKYCNTEKYICKHPANNELHQQSRVLCINQRIENSKKVCGFNGRWFKEV